MGTMYKYTFVKQMDAIDIDVIVNTYAKQGYKIVHTQVDNTPYGNKYSFVVEKEEEQPNPNGSLKDFKTSHEVDDKIDTQGR